MAEAGEARDLLVTAPGGAYRTWERAIDDHLSDEMRERTLVHVWRSDRRSKVEKDRLKRFLDASSDPKRPRALLVNIEAVSAVERARDLMEEFLRQRPAVLAVDESTTIKSPFKPRTRYMVERFGPLAPYRRILSGLPTPKDPLDLFSQFEFLNWRILGHRAFMPFRSRYAKVVRKPFGPLQYDARTGEYYRKPVDVVEEFKNVEELWGLIEPHSFRKRLDQCYDVPKTLYLQREVRLTMEQLRVYEDLRQFWTSSFSATEHVTPKIVVDQMLKMHQVLCGFVPLEDGTLKMIDENRTDELVGVLQEYDGKAIVWCSYDESIERVYRRLEKEFGEGCCARFWGGNKNTREDEERRFKEDPRCRYMASTQAAGGMGRTWDVADLMVYHSSKDNLEHRDQSEQRTSAVGKERPTTVIDLVSPGTVDEKILYALREKIDLAAAVTRDGWRPWVV